MIAKGLTNREISGALGIALGTTKIHVSAVIEAPDVTNRTDAAAFVSQLMHCTRGNGSSQAELKSGG